MKIIIFCIIFGANFTTAKDVSKVEFFNYCKDYDSVPDLIYTSVPASTSGRYITEIFENFKVNVKLYDDYFTYVDENRATNFEDLRSGYFFDKMFSFQNLTHPNRELERHGKEIVRGMKKFYEKTTLRKEYREYGIYEAKVCTANCGVEYKPKCLEIKKIN